jgi:hypothetical protein
VPYKANEPRRHKIPKARHKIENWAEYDAALRAAGQLDGLGAGGDRAERTA